MLVYLGILVGVYRFLLERHVGLSIRRLIPELGPALAGCLALAAVAEPLRLACETALPRVLTLGVAGSLRTARLRRRPARRLTGRLERSGAARHPRAAAAGAAEPPRRHGHRARQRRRRALADAGELKRRRRPGELKLRLTHRLRLAPRAP